MAKINWNNVIDQLQAALVWAVIGVLVFCTLVLLAFDSLAGAGVGMNLTRGNLFASIVISLATTGLLTAVAFLAYLAGKYGYNGASKALAIISVLFLLIDIYLDSLGADILHYGAIVAANSLPVTERGVHIIYRVLIGGLSTVGEPLALAIITGMPVLKEIINNAIPASQRTYPQKNTGQQQNVRQLSEYMAQERAQRIEQQRHSQTVSTRPTPRPVPQHNDEPTYHPVSYQQDKE